MASQRDKYSSGIKNSLNDTDPANDADFDWDQIEEHYDNDGRRRNVFQEENSFLIIKKEETVQY